LAECVSGLAAAEKLYTRTAGWHKNAAKRHNARRRAEKPQAHSAKPKPAGTRNENSNSEMKSNNSRITILQWSNARFAKQTTFLSELLYADRETAYYSVKRFP
jgi:hypothetical protein